MITWTASTTSTLAMDGSNKVPMSAHLFDTIATRRRPWIVDEQDNEEETAVGDDKSPTRRHTISIPSLNNDRCLTKRRRQSPTRSLPLSFRTAIMTRTIPAMESLNHCPTNDKADNINSIDVSNGGDNEALIVT